MYSQNSHAPTGTMRNGASDPSSAALATLLCVAPAKNTARLSPKNTPGTSTRRTSLSRTRRPWLQSTPFHTRLTVTIRQKATSTPGDSARLTSVELSENATTSPSTASTPTARALSAGLRVGGSANSGRLTKPAAYAPARTAKRRGYRRVTTNLFSSPEIHAPHGGLI